MKLWKYIKENMEKTPSQSICEDGAKMRYDDLIVWVESFAKKLEGNRSCAILCNSEMAQGMALLSCFAANVTAIPLSARYGDNHYNKILDLIEPDALIMDADGEFHIYRIPDAKYKAPNESPALIMCTSGTTGNPKGVMLSEDNIINNVSDILDYFKIDAKDSILISRPLYHCAVLTGEFIASLVSGVKIRFYSGTFNPIHINNIIQKYKITTIGLTPTLFDMLICFDRKKKRSSIRNICVSGECMDRDQGLRIASHFDKAKIYHVYGLTEACPRVCYLPPKLFTLYPECVGFPLRSVSIKLVNENGDIAAVGEEGTLWVKGENVMSGYYNDPKKTSEVIKDGWLCTGDMAVINDDGLLKILGRKDHLIIKAGMNIYPAEIESALKGDRRVKEVLAYGYKIEYGIQIGIKVVGYFNSIEEIKKLCNERLPIYQIPSRIEIVDELPKGVSGKILRNIENKENS